MYVLIEFLIPVSKLLYEEISFFSFAIVLEKSVCSEYIIISIPTFLLEIIFKKNYNIHKKKILQKNKKNKKRKLKKFYKNVEKKFFYDIIYFRKNVIKKHKRRSNEQ